MVIPLRKIAEAVDGTLDGDGTTLITGAGALDGAKEGDIAYVDTLERVAEGERTAAAALIVPSEAPACSKPVIRTPQPRLAFAKLLALFAPEPRTSPGTHPSAVVGDALQMGDGASVGALAYLGNNVRLGDGVIVGPQACIGDDVCIGARTVVNARVVVHERTVIGEDCIIHSGAVLGADGFGFVPTEDGLHKVPQIGRVVVGNDVEIGANTTIDRGTVGETRIEDGAKIDNLVHIAHNCIVGRHVVICGQTGLSGSVRLEDGAVLGGQVGIRDNTVIGARARIGAQGGVISDVPPGAVYSGYPARPHNQQMRAYAALQRLPELVKRVRQLEKELERREGIENT